MLQFPIYIKSIRTLSTLGSTSLEIWNAYLQKDLPYIEYVSYDEKKVVVSPLQEKHNEELIILANSDSKYRTLDRSVLMSLYTARNAFEDSGWQKGTSFGVNIGSSRGATSLFEKYHREFVKENYVATLTSPTTTLGNISSWIGHDLSSKGVTISHSIACSTGLHSILNAVAWLQSGLATHFIAGASEAPLTSFTIEQMRALKIYTQHLDVKYPCRALDLTKSTNQMFLGEAAVMVCLQKQKDSDINFAITGVGYATEVLQHNISISKSAQCFQDSMRMALQGHNLDSVDGIVMHAPGTIKGDLSEYNAIVEVFSGSEIPLLTSNKWKIGHSFASSGLMSLELACLILEYQVWIDTPTKSFLDIFRKDMNDINKLIVNAVGFGGNAVSIVVEKLS